MNSLQTLGINVHSFSERTTWDLDMAELESLRIRTELMLALRRHIQQQQWTLEEAAHIFHQSSPRMQNLINGEISRFSVEDLIQLLTRAGLTVSVSIQPPHSAAQ